MTKLLILLPLFPYWANAQLYTDASANLPNNGARGPSMDVRAADLDGDSDLDLVFAREFQPNVILFNNGAGVFTNATSGRLPQPSHDSEDVAVADFDKDGDLDLIFCSEDDIRLGRTNVHEYYLNDGAGRFTTAPYIFPDSEANAVISTDLTGDGAPEVLFGNNGQNFLLINNGAGAFTNETAMRLPAINDVTQDLLLADFDGDGDLDLFAGNETGNRLLINDGAAKFADESTARLPAGLNLETRKVAAGDVDGDRDLDIFLSNVGFIPGKNRQNRLFINDGRGFFKDSTATHLPADNEDTLDGIFEDVDFDGDLDLVIANVNLQLAGRLKIYVNNGRGRFADGTPAILPQAYFINALGVIAADLNGDGARDLYFCDRNNGSNGKDVLLLRHRPATGVDEAETSARSFVLHQSYPNPFSHAAPSRATGVPATTIRYEIPRDAKVILKIHTLLGQEIKTLVDEVQSSGLQTARWDGKDRFGREVPSGVYIYTLQIGETIFSRKLALVR
jgi:hypothetical protein